MKIIEHLTRAVRAAAKHNHNVEIGPACILWPDASRQWEPALPRLKSELPELLTLGDYQPEQRQGPAIWLRCALAGVIAEIAPGERPFILYLPGVSRQDLRAVESCPDHLKPLAELQYRGTIWSQINARDWTVLAFLKSESGGLNLDVAQDDDTGNAMLLSLERLLDEETDLLQDKRLDKDYFNLLVSGGDTVRDLLDWLNQGEAFKTKRGDKQWKAFVQISKSKLAFDPQSKGRLAGAAKLAEHLGPWQVVWERFCEAPRRYPNIPAQIRQCQPPSDTIYWPLPEGHEGWPQYNEAQEADLGRELLALADLPAHEARKKLTDLEARHGARRALVWAELGEEPLARALEHLAELAEITATALCSGTIDDLASGYRHHSWKADRAVLRALAQASDEAAFQAISAAIRQIYLPWADDSARHLQTLVQSGAYKGTDLTGQPKQYEPGTCLLFVDGLRFDAGQRLGELLEAFIRQV